MKNILIIAWYSNPSQATAAQRADSWAQYFKRHHLYPIIITRNWELPTQSMDDLELPVGHEVKILKDQEKEVHYVPFKGGLKSRILQKWPLLNRKIIRAPLILLELFLQHTFTFITPYNELFKYVLAYLSKNQTIDGVLICGDPFHLFKLGHLIHQAYGTKWYADYRDAWSTNKISLLPYRLLNSLNHFISAYYEKKWLRTATMISSVTPQISEGIEHLIGKECHTIYNGFFQEEVDLVKQNSKEPLNDTFSIMYSGSILVHSQSFKIFAEGFILFVKEISKQPFNKKIELVFLGSAWDQRVDVYLKSLFHPVVDFVKFEGRRNRIDNLKRLSEASIFLMVSYNDAKGILSSKIFEYMALKKPILLAPSDKDIVEEFAIKSKMGVICHTSTDVQRNLKWLYNEPFKAVADNVFISNFSRENQVKTFCELIKKTL